MKKTTVLRSLAPSMILLALSTGVVPAAELLTPIDVISSLNDEEPPIGPDFYAAINLIGDAGLPDGEELTVFTYGAALHDPFGTSTAWVSQDPAPAAGDWYGEGNPEPVLTFYLDDVYWLTDFIVWGYASSTAQNNNEAKTFSIELSADGGSTWSAPQEVIHQRTGRAAETLALPVPGFADTIRVTITDNFFGEAGAAGGDRVGLGEVKFLGEPEADPLLSAPATIFRVFTLTEEFDVPVHNAGSAQPLTISAVTFTGDDAAKFSTVGALPTLAPGTSGVIRVRFQAGGGFDAVSTVMSLTSNDSAQPEKLTLLRGVRKASAVLITPSAVESLTNTLEAPLGPDFYPPDNLVNNSGLADGESLTADTYQSVAHAATAAANAWVTTAPGGAGSLWYADGRPEPVLTFTLDQTYIVSGTVIWGYGGPNNNEARTIRIALSTDGGTTWGAEQTIIHNRVGPAQHTVELAQPGPANAVRFTIEDNYFAVAGIGGGGDRVGLNEVKFLGQAPRDPLVLGPERLNLPLIDGQEFDITLHNAGAAQTLTLGTPVFLGTDAAKFSIVSSPPTLAPGATGQVRVKFDADDITEPVAATLSIPTNDSQVVDYTVFITGTAYHAWLAVEPSTIDFGVLASVTAEVPITVRNPGTEPLQVNPEVWGGAAALYELDIDLDEPLAGGASVQGTLRLNTAGAQGPLPVRLRFSNLDDPATPPAVTIPVTASRPITDKLVAYWPLNDTAEATTAADALGGHPGEAEGVAFGAEGPPVDYAGTAAYFDGVSSRIRVEHTPALNSGSFTLTAWANLEIDPGTAHRSLVTNRDDANGVSGGNNGFILYAVSNNWQFWTGDSVGGWNSTATAFAIGTWQHLALVYDAGTSTKRLYLDGTQIGITAVAYSPNGPQNEPLWIGAGADAGTSFYWPGLIDEVALFRVALTPEEILTVMNEGVASFIGTPPPAGSFAITAYSIDPATGSTSLTWDSEAGVTYRVESSTTLAGGAGGWTTVATDLPATGASTTWTGTVTPPEGGRVFFRISRL